MIHPLQGRNMDIHIIVDTNFLLSFIISVEASGILCQCCLLYTSHNMVPIDLLNEHILRRQDIDAGLVGVIHDIPELLH